LGITSLFAGKSKDISWGGRGGGGGGWGGGGGGFFLVGVGGGVLFKENCSSPLISDFQSFQRRHPEGQFLAKKIILAPLTPWEGNGHTLHWNKGSPSVLSARGGKKS